MALERVISKEFRNVRFDLFLDRAKVRSALDRKNRRVLARTGGFTRTVVRRSMKKGGKRATTRTSQPGQPPRWHTRGLKDNVFFFYDPKRTEVVIGPRPFKSTNTTKPRRRASGASLLEFGGSATITTNVRRSRRRSRLRAYFKRRPFMEPARPKAIAKFRDLMRSVRLGR